MDQQTTDTDQQTAHVGAQTTCLDRAKALSNRVINLALKNKRIVILAVCVMVFVELLDDILEGDLMRLDTFAYWFFVENLRSDAITPVMEAFSNLATPLCLLVLLLMVAAFAPGKRPGLCCALNLVLVIILNQVLKALVQRPRPEGFNLVVESGFSFPSGHSMVAMAFFGLFIWLVWKYKEDSTMRMVSCVCFAIIIVMMGISRIYLGVHYASDVIAGFCVSLAWLAIYTRVVAPLFLEGAIPRRKDSQ